MQSVLKEFGLAMARKTQEARAALLELEERVEQTAEQARREEESLRHVLARTKKAEDQLRRDRESASRTEQSMQEEAASLEQEAQRVRTEAAQEEAGAVQTLQALRKAQEGSAALRDAYNAQLQRLDHQLTQALDACVSYKESVSGIVAQTQAEVAAILRGAGGAESPDAVATTVAAGQRAADWTVAADEEDVHLLL
jgi:chromosome segregation ATPase